MTSLKVGGYVAVLMLNFKKKYRFFHIGKEEQGHTLTNTNEF